MDVCIGAHVRAYVHEYVHVLATHVRKRSPVIVHASTCATGTSI